jgi:hypothetical protein
MGHVVGPLDPGSFREYLSNLGLSINQFACLAGVHPITCRHWGRMRSGRVQQAFPGWVALLLEAWTNHPSLIDWAVREIQSDPAHGEKV